MEAFNFTVANEDHNLYTFDMRNLDIALQVHTDHVGAVYVSSPFSKMLKHVGWMSNTRQQAENL